jgi:hypothetical protein
MTKIATRLGNALLPDPEALPVQINDPIGGALKDAELLIAYSAQSRRSIKSEKIVALAEAIDAARRMRQNDLSTPPAQASAFWIAYDALAVEMAPLSAHSIRSSIRVNSRRFPASLFTPTAYIATTTVSVFLLCLALQGFWVAGKELIDRADQLELQKTEVQQRAGKNAGTLRRSEAKLIGIREQLCQLAKCDEFETVLPSGPTRREDQARYAALAAEHHIVQSDVSEREQLEREQNLELQKLNERGQPLEDLLNKWHKRARSVCDRPYLRFLCPVDNPNVGADTLTTKRDKVEKLRADYEKLQVANEESKFAQKSDSVPKRLALRSLQRALSIEQQELARLEAYHFRSIAVEVRIIVANLGAYLIAMVMGILGALTFILRTMSRQLAEHTYVPVSASASIIRICLGAIAGVFGSLLAPGADATLKTLPPLFVPFVFGYGIEILFSLLDKVVGTFTQAEPGTIPAPRSR